MRKSDGNLAAVDLTTALALARQDRIDCAYLDLNLLGEEVYPVADLLGQRRIPYVIASGYGPDRLNDAYHHAPLLLKPFTAPELVNVIRQLARRSANGGILS